MTAKTRGLHKSKSLSNLDALSLSNIDVDLQCVFKEAQKMKQQSQLHKVNMYHFASKGPNIKMHSEDYFIFEESDSQPESEEDSSATTDDCQDHPHHQRKEAQSTDEIRREFEGKENTEKFQARLRATCRKRRDDVVGEADRFLDWMKEKGGGSITIAWRRYFDSDGDGELSFIEFCNALATMNYEVDTVQLWHQFGGGLENKALSLEALDPRGNDVLQFFAEWCKNTMGGPMEVFAYMDADHSDSLEPDEFTEGLQEMGFFDVPGIPSEIDDEEKALKNLYPLLDQNGNGCVQAEQMLFLEQDRVKRDKQYQQIRRQQDFGAITGGIEEVKDAEKLLHKVCSNETQLGGKFWKMIPENNVLPTSLTSSRVGSRAASRAASSVASPCRSGLWSPSTPGLRSLGKRTPKAGSTASSFHPRDTTSASSTLMASGTLTFPPRLPLASRCSEDSGTSAAIQSGSPDVTGGFSSTAMATGGFSHSSAGALASSSTAGPLAAVSEVPEKPRVQRDRLASLTSSLSLPNIKTPSPDITSRFRRIAAEKNNADIRTTAKRKLHGARKMYGASLVTPLPKVNPKDPIVPAKASLILPESRHHKSSSEEFDPRRSAGFDFFKSSKAQNLFSHYYRD